MVKLPSEKVGLAVVEDENSHENAASEKRARSERGAKRRTEGCLVVALCSKREERIVTQFDAAAAAAVASLPVSAPNSGTTQARISRESAQ